MEPIHINIADIAKVELLMGNIQFSYTRVKGTNIWVQYAADLGPDEVSGFFTCRHCGLYEYDGDKLFGYFLEKMKISDMSGLIVHSRLLVMNYLN